MNTSQMAEALEMMKKAVAMMETAMGLKVSPESTASSTGQISNI